MAPKRKMSSTAPPSAKRARRANGVNAGPAHPPAIRASNASTKQTIRFIVQPGAGGNYTITANNIADLVCYAKGSSYPYRLTDRFRIRKVELWSPPAADGGPNVLGFQFVGNTQATSDNQVFMQDVSLGSDRPAHLVARPPKNTSHGNWQIGSPSIAFQMYVAAGTVIDLTLDLTWQDIFSASTACSTVQATGATDILCCKALDGLSYILPQGWQVA